MSDNPRLTLAVNSNTKLNHAPNQALAAIRARTVMEVMRERNELTRDLHDVFGSGDEREESSSLLKLPWHQSTH